MSVTPHTGSRGKRSYGGASLGYIAKLYLKTKLLNEESNGKV